MLWLNSEIFSLLHAVMASDFSILQFQLLERLLVVHGYWCYKRIALMVGGLRSGISL
ncbi:hypothetical protein Sjap_018079 [Stephania japonica]|uniref:P-type ATPase C-terminal domain-containing protein n=1 Tax=Stephania japonica TaxID=461633 RepID=A0AAP0NKQ3_9MAGN